MPEFQGLVDKLMELRDIYKKKKQFTDEDSQQLKNVMKDLPGLKEVTHSIRNDTLTFFDIHDLKPNEILLKKENPATVYILVSGTIKKSIYAPWNSYKEEEDKKDLDLISQKQQFQELNALCIFGNLNLLNPDKFSKGMADWKPCYLYSLSQSIVYALNHEKVFKYMDKLVQNKQIQEKQNFLSKNVPGLSNLLTSNRDKVLSLFYPVNFIQNQVIIHEDTVPNEACIIVEGQCSLLSKRIPVHLNLKEDDKRNRHLDVFFPLNKGYFSKTMNSFQIGIISEDQWIADELLLIAQQERYNYLMQQIQSQEGPDQSLNNTKSQWEISQKAQEIQSQKKQKQYATQFQYSVTAKTNVLAYAISKEDLLTKLPKDIQQQVNKQAVKKQEWINNRYREIQNDVHKIYNMEQQYQKYVDHTKESVKLFPQASRQTLKLMNDRSQSKLNVFDKDPENEVLMNFINLFTIDLDELQKRNDKYTNNRVLLEKVLILGRIQDSLQKLVTHSETLNFHNNPYEASKSPSSQEKSLFGKQQQLDKSPVRVSLSDKIANTIGKYKDSQGSKSKDKKVMDSAGYIRGQNNMLYLPMITRASEMDKTLKIVGKNTRSQRILEDQQLFSRNDNRKQETIEVKVGDKTVKIMNQLTERRYQ